MIAERMVNRFQNFDISGLKRFKAFLHSFYKFSNINELIYYLKAPIR